MSHIHFAHPNISKIDRDDRLFSINGETLALRMTSLIKPAICYKVLGNSLSEENITELHKHQFIILNENTLKLMCQTCFLNLYKARPKLTLTQPKGVLAVL